MSAACTLCKVMISPVTRCTATRTPCTLNPIVRGDRYALRLTIEAVANLGACRMELGKRHLLVGADDRIVLQSAIGRLAAEMPAGESNQHVAEREGGLLHRLAGNDGPGAGEGAGVVRGLIGVAIDDGDVARACAEHGGGNLAVRRGRAVAHLGRANREVVAAIGQEAYLGARAVLGWRA